MRALLLALGLVACTTTAYPPKATAQTPRYVIFDQHVRNVLAKEWDAHAHDPVILERAYCVSYQRDWWIIPEPVWRVVEIEPAAVEDATPHSVTFRCPSGMTSLHVHPAQTCFSGTDCVGGSAEAGQCFPSDADVRVVVWFAAPFGAIQCARDAIVFYLAPPAAS